MNEDTATNMFEAIAETRDMLTLIEYEVAIIEALREDGDGLALVKAIDASPLWDSTELLNNVLSRYDAAFTAYQEANTTDEV